MSDQPQLFIINVLVPQVDSINGYWGKLQGEQKIYSVAAFSLQEALEAFKAEFPEEAEYIVYCVPVNGRVWLAS